MSHLRPLGHRVLIRPDDQPTESEAGLILPENRDHVPVSGTIVAVGNGPERDQRIRLAVISRCVSIVEELASMGVRDPQDYLTEMGRYRDHLERFDPPIRVGDRVVYPVEAGLAVTEDGVSYVLMREDEVAIVVHDTEAATEAAAA